MLANGWAGYAYLSINIFSLTSVLTLSKVRSYDQRTKKYDFEYIDKLVAAQL